MDPDGQFISNQPDPDPQHWQNSLFFISGHFIFSTWFSAQSLRNIEKVFYDIFDIVLCVFQEQTTGVAGTPAG